MPPQAPGHVKGAMAAPSAESGPHTVTRANRPTNFENRLFGVLFAAATVLVVGSVSLSSPPFCSPAVDAAAAAAASAAAAFSSAADALVAASAADAAAASGDAFCIHISKAPSRSRTKLGSIVDRHCLCCTRRLLYSIESSIAAISTNAVVTIRPTPRAL